MSEDAIQEQVMAWANSQLTVHPELSRLFHIPNGGHRHRVVAAGLKRQGVKPGVPDLFLPVPRFGCHGLWIEMKTKAGRVSADQKDWLAHMRLVGYRAEVCRSFEDARSVLLDYLHPKIPFNTGVV